MRIIRFSDLEITPWKNGGGITREIAVLRIEDKIMWRLSMANVDSDGAFSIFENLTRILTVIKGNGIRLVSTDKTITAVLGVPVEFDGALPIHSELIDGAIGDLNVMFDASLCEASVVLATGPLQLQPSQAFAIIGLSGNGHINSIYDLQVGDTALIENLPVDLSLPQGASALVVTLSMRNQTSASNAATALS